MEDTPREVTGSTTARRAYGVLSLAAAYDVSPQFIRLEHKRGRLRGCKLGRRLVFTDEAVRAWVQAAERIAREGIA